jgi:maleylacetate reductase
MIAPFIHNSFAGRVVFGAGSLASLPDELARLGARRAVVLSTPEQHATAQKVLLALGERGAGVFDQAVMHVPMEVALAAREFAKSVNADACIAVGGGSTIGLGKAIALTSDLPIIAVPTTFAGSEMTAIWGITDAGVKTTGRDLKVLPKTVIYDAQMVRSLPPAVAATSGLNAIAHCVEALYAIDRNPILTMVSEEGIRALARGLPGLVSGHATDEQWGDAQYGAWLAGTALNGSSMAIHHKLCHTLGGTFNLLHADTHTVVLPYATAYNRDAAPEAMARIRAALGAWDDGDAASSLLALSKALGVRTNLKDIGMPFEGIELAAELAVKNPYYNPRPVEREGIIDLLTRAYHGDRP